MCSSRSFSPPADTTSTLQSRSNSRSSWMAMRSRGEAPGSNSTRKSMPLPAPSSPRATEPKTDTDRARLRTDRTREKDRRGFCCFDGSPVVRGGGGKGDGHGFGCLASKDEVRRSMSRKTFQAVCHRALESRTYGLRACEPSPSVSVKSSATKVFRPPRPAETHLGPGEKGRGPDHERAV